VVNEYLEASAADIFAAGDCAKFHDIIFAREQMVGNWANATSQGAAVGHTMAGQRTVFATVSSYSDTFFEGRYSFIGVCDEQFADEIISRGSSKEGKMSQIFIKNIDGETRIVGATVINNPAEVGPLTLAVKNRTNVWRRKRQLADAGFDLKNLLA
jgi:NADPH-dependent 2,4-dienoyl-CoA reductase/sulfur reductase-like enzyme